MHKCTAQYCRVSTDRQIQDSQMHALARYFDGLPEEQILTFEDKATGKDEQRPGFQALRRAIEAGKIKKLVFWRLSRLGRSSRNVLEFIEFCIRHGVELTSLNEHLDTNSAFGRAMITIMTAFDQMAREIISENVKTALDALREKNKDNPDFSLGNTKWASFWSQKLRDLAPVVMQLHLQKCGSREIAKRVGLSKTSVLKIIAVKGKLPPNVVREDWKRLHPEK